MWHIICDFVWLRDGIMEDFITLSIIGFITGIVFSIPIWGPISVLIAANGLQGKWRYCVFLAIGSGIIDTVVCFIDLQGFAKVIGLIGPFIPYLFLAGAAILFVTGIRTVKTGIDVKQADDVIKKRAFLRGRGGLRTGLVINASNPSILFGWLSSSFLAISFAASLGVNVGGFDRSIGAGMHALKTYSAYRQSAETKAKEATASLERPEKKETFNRLPFLAGTGFACSAGLGTIVWYSAFSYALARFRLRFNKGIMTGLVQGLGIMLCILAVYFLVRAVTALVDVASILRAFH